MTANILSSEIERILGDKVEWTQMMQNAKAFNKPGAADASIVNKGTITAAEGGLVALVAPAVRNDGVIQARAGSHSPCIRIIDTS